MMERLSFRFFFCYFVRKENQLETYVVLAKPILSNSVRLFRQFENAFSLCGIFCLIEIEWHIVPDLI